MRKWTKKLADSTAVELTHEGLYSVLYPSCDESKIEDGLFAIGYFDSWTTLKVLCLPLIWYINLIFQN